MLRSKQHEVCGVWFFPCAGQDTQILTALMRLRSGLERQHSRVLWDAVSEEARWSQAFRLVLRRQLRSLLLPA
jgi:hypothetical protein